MGRRQENAAAVAAGLKIGSPKPAQQQNLLAVRNTGQQSEMFLIDTDDVRVVSALTSNPTQSEGMAAVPVNPSFTRSSVLLLLVNRHTER